MRGWLLVVLLCFGVTVGATEPARESLPSAAIKGIEANPRVTFIVPWQRSRMRDFPLLPAHSALDEFFTPLSSRQLELDLELARRDAVVP